MAGYKITAGNAEIISFTDLRMEFPWQVFFPHVPSAEMEEYRELYPECWGELGFVTDAGAYGIRSDGKTIVVDTGLGPGPHAWLRGARGELVSDMKKKGLDPADVDAVLHTHLHADHVGWNMTDDRPTFPNARYYASRVDWEYFNAMLAASPQIPAQVIPLNEEGRLEIFDGDLSLTPEVTTIATPGHTPGHRSILVSSGGEEVLITGDLAHHPAQVDRTDWSPAFDIDPQQSAATRKEMVERIVDEGLIAAFCHFPGEGFGRITESGGKRIFQAL